MRPIQPTLFAAVLALSTLLTGCCKSRQNDAATIRGLEQGWDAAGMRGDDAYTKSIVADDYSGLSDHAKVPDKAALLADMHSLPATYSSFTPDGPVTVTLYGDTAIAQGRDTYVTKSGQTGHNAFVDTWKRRHGHWQIISTVDFTPM